VSHLVTAAAAVTLTHRDSFSQYSDFS